MTEKIYRPLSQIVADRDKVTEEIRKLQAKRGALELELTELAQAAQKAADE